MKQKVICREALNTAALPQQGNRREKGEALLKRRFLPAALAAICVAAGACNAHTAWAGPTEAEEEGRYSIAAAAQAGAEALKKALFYTCSLKAGTAALQEDIQLQAPGAQQGHTALPAAQERPAEFPAAETDAAAEGRTNPAAEAGKPAAEAVKENFSASYLSGAYYQRLREVVLTGNYRADILAVAQSQLGYREGDNESQLDGSACGSGDYTEYCRQYNQLGRPWCSEFASWCARQAGIPIGIFGDSKSATARNFGGDYHPWGDTVYAGGDYEPLPGDLVLFVWGDKSPDAAMKDHTAFFTGANWNGDRLTILTLDGNSGNMVQNNSRGVLDLDSGEVSRGHIAGFVAPRYGDSTEASPRPQNPAQPAEEPNQQEEKPELPKTPEQTDEEQPAETPDEKGETPEDPEEGQETEAAPGDAEEAIRLINSEREANGLEALELNDSLMEIAQYQASVYAGRAAAPVQTISGQLDSYGISYSEKKSHGYVNYQTAESLMESIRCGGEFITGSEDFDQIGVGSCWREGDKQLQWYIIAVKAA